MQIVVYVPDARENHGNLNCLVTPVEGEGRQWVSVDRLREEEADEPIRDARLLSML